MSQTDWLPGAIALAVGLVVGLGMLIWLQNRKAARPSREKPEQLADLERRAQLLIDQLKELIEDRHHLEPAQFEAEKQRLELEAAAALRARDECARGVVAA